MSSNLVFQDVTAISIALKAYFLAHPLPDLDFPVSDVGHLKVKDGAAPPYIIIYDYGAVNVENFKNTIVAIDTQYVIEAITQDTPSNSAQEIAQLVLDGVYKTLHGQPIVVNGFKVLNLHQGPKEPTQWEDVDDRTQYLHAGRRYLGTLAPLG